MLISKFNLYKPEWLELVFDNRNKEYGAYYLRQHYAGTVNRAMFITFSGVALFVAGAMVLRSKPAPAIHDHTTVVTLSTVQPPVVPPKKIDPPKQLPPTKMTAFNQPVVKPDVDVHIPPPEVAKIQGVIGPVTIDGIDNGQNVIDNSPPGNGPVTQPTPNNEIYTGVDEMPVPMGGESAWAKFLGKNLRFPAEAQDIGVSGRVIVSFVIEKDGSLSDIQVVRGAGHGFDEEALRVLKLAKPWKPGKQNGQPVRVRYNIPINFQLAE